MVGMTTQDGVSVGAASPHLESLDYEIMPAVASVVKFDQATPAVATGLVVFSIDGLPTGTASFRLSYGIPFSASRADGSEVQGALVAEGIGPGTLAEVIESGRHPEGSLSGRVLLNQRTRVVLRALKANGGPPDSDRALVTLFFLQSSKELAFTNFVEVDDDMEDAETFLSSVVSNKDDFLRLFPEAIDRKSAEDTLRDFKQIKATQQQKVVHAISSRINGGTAATREEACTLALSTNDFLMGLSDDRREVFDPDLRRTTQNLTNVLICRWRALSWKLDAVPEDAEVRLADAQGSLEQMVSVLEDYSGSPASEAKVISNATKSLDDLKARIALREVEKNRSE